MQEIAPALSSSIMNLSEKAQASQQALREAAAAYQTVVDQVIENPQGRFVERLREAEEQVAEAAARWALDFVEGVQRGEHGA